VFTWKKQKTKGQPASHVHLEEQKTKVQPASRVHLEETEDQGTAG